MSSKCPPVTLNVDEVVEAAKNEILSKCPSFGKKTAHVDADVHSIGVKGLGKISLVEPSLNMAHFAAGFVTIPSVVNFATKLMQIGVILPQADMAVSRGVATGLTLIGTLLSGGKSFLFGALLGQVPTTIDAIADVAITAIAKAKAVVPAPAAPATGVNGLNGPEDELLKLREDLQKLSGLGTSTEYEGAMSGVKFHY